MPPSGVNESCMALTAPHEAAVVMAANSPDSAMPKPGFLAFHVAKSWIDAQLRQQRIGLLLENHCRAGQNHKHHRHCGKHRPATAGIADHTPR